MVVLLLNPSSASAGLKLIIAFNFKCELITSKPVFGFGWIETGSVINKVMNKELLLNPSSASAGLKRRVE